MLLVLSAVSMKLSAAGAQERLGEVASEQRLGEKAGTLVGVRQIRAEDE